MKETIKNKNNHKAIKKVYSTISEYVTDEEVVEMANEVRNLMSPKNNFFQMIYRAIPNDKKEALMDLIWNTNQIMSSVYMLNINRNYGSIFFPNVEYFNDMFKKIEEANKTIIDPKEAIKSVNPNIVEEFYNALKDASQMNLDSGKKCGIQPPTTLTKVRENN